MQMSKKWLSIIVLALPSMIIGQSQAQAANKADGIAAIVSTDVITQRELNNRISAMRVSGVSVSPAEALSLLIDEKLMEEQADQYGIRIDNRRMQQTLEEIARENGMTVQGLQAAARQYGVDWNSYIENLRQQMRMEELRSQVVQSRVHVTEQDVDAFLIQNPTGMYPDYKKNVVHQPRYEQREVVEQSFEPKAVAFQHIYIRVPENASPEVEQAARQKAEEALAKIRRGQSFAAVARQYSDAPEAQNGGDLGIRLNEDWPSLFINETRRVRDGGTSRVFKAPNGFHILRVVERRGIVNQTRKVVNVRLPDPPQAQFTPRELAARHNGPVEVTESHIRHILVRTTPIVSSAQAKAKIDQLYQRLQNGEAFADVAVDSSQDASAPLGGDIGWIAPGQADPSFQAAADNLQIGQVSTPVQSAFGWHIIEVLDRRTEDKQAGIRREIARETLYQQQAENVLQDWVQQLRSQSYIDNRITGEKTQR